MPAEERITAFAFKSEAFNTTEQRAYFINPECYGDDVARWLSARLRANGYRADEEPGQEDFGWYFSFDVAGVPHDIVVGFRPADEDEAGEWLCWVERETGLIGSLLGRRKYVSPEAMEAIRTILDSPVISGVRFCAEKQL